MEDSESRCSNGEIPARLHRNGRPKIDPLPNSDYLYIRHDRLEDGLTYAQKGQIPGFRLKTQSANSHELNTPDGDPKDVLLNTEGGPHHWSLQIARLPLSELVKLDFPNENTDRKKLLKTGEKDVFKFRVEHEPTACMYPHCDIIPFKNGEKAQDIPQGMKTLVRLGLAELADKSRLEMHQYLS